MVPPPSMVGSELAILVPFFITACIYMIVNLISSLPLWMKGLTKILPIICLCMFVVHNGKKILCSHHNLLKLLMGLMFSAVGDVLLLMDDIKFFIGGGTMFALAHCFYTWAFGFKPLNLRAGSLLATVVVLGLIFLSRCSKMWQMLLLCCYCVLIGVMSWRANAEVLFYRQRTATKVTGGIGAVLFMVSDFTLATNLLCFPVPHDLLIVMTTYYLAQLFITLGIVRDNKMKGD
ncbi:lysoplasmalogenase-like protein TMEM86A [Carcharodon carcharias]|uniref:lysoplasmalogenase-like protein TMEM86A n=1 Tax=Carcharodon carcharias TaxID=13397 RepID=UPI001B7E5E1D|nr:lysoplasmalogenase-like protein TMEM86A [Carcharodon carcharias]